MSESWQVDGRPILESDPLTRHYAYRFAGTAGVWGWTWCGEAIPEEHQCPDGNNLELQMRHNQQPVGNCVECDDWYRHGQKARRRAPAWA